jgi:hypothetical protein
MKHFEVHQATQILVIESGEKVIETIETFCTENAIFNAEISGLGAVDEISCGYYDLQKRVYDFNKYEGLFEVVNIAGNVMRKEAGIFVHMHATFTDEQNNAFGGHVQEMRVGVTLELVLRIFKTNLKREFDDKTGLFLISGH